jgi:uncharacterized protein YkwD
MRTIILIAIFQAVILSAIFIISPIYASLGKPPSSTEPIAERPSSDDSNPPILATNPTSADATLDYSTTAQNTPTNITFLEDIEQQVLILTNVERRKKRKLRVLQHDATLQLAARAHSADMLDRNFFDHASPEGRTSFDRIAVIHRTLIGGTGENLWQGKGYDISDAKKLAKIAVDSLMNSPGHRENILRQDYSHLGVGAALKGDTVKITQNFASTQARFQQPLPLQLNNGDNLSLATTPGLRKSSPVKYGFWLPDKGVLAAEPLPINQTQIAIEAGDYRLRFYFITSRRRTSVNYIIFNGPQIVVK